MLIDPENHIVKRCAEGMDMEGQGKAHEARIVFQQAWDDAKDDIEQFIAAHYVARHQDTIADKLKWDEKALTLALRIDNEEVKAAYASLYLNIAKCYEDLNQFDKALENYHLANANTKFLLEDGYGNMIKVGINNGIKRVKNHQNLK